MAEHPSCGSDIHVSEEEIYKNFHQYNFDTNPRFISGWIKIRDKIEPARYEQELLRAKLFFYSRTIEKVDKEEYERWIARSQLKGNKDGCSNDSDTETFTAEHGHEAGSDKGDNSILSTCIIPAMDHTPRIQMKSDYVHLKDKLNDQLTGYLEEKAKICGTDNNKQEQTEHACKCIAADNVGNVLNEGSCAKDGAMDNGGNVLKGGCEKAKEMHPDVGVNDDTEMETKNREKNSASNYPASFSELISLLESGCKIPGIEELNVQPTNENPTASALDRKRKPWEK
ncbi:hypothetical protein CHS0354_038782 [Potamilus streckersoni]|uniref:Uncharacterized protein n=1 Tax=Potamilus streckersoni TaxID=2493646 RepID=A0AAE0SRG4_9BIVA|nr:hypothetical protein CHS0354_038782 [Potamilus streckersoni]